VEEIVVEAMVAVVVVAGALTLPVAPGRPRLQL